MKIRQSASSSSSMVPVITTPVSKKMMPELDSFKRGSRIELASGTKVLVEDISETDFIQSAAYDGGVKILRCTLVSIEGQELIGAGHPSLCKMILRVESQDNQQVISINSFGILTFFICHWRLFFSYL